MCKVIWVEVLERVEILLLKSWDDAMGWVGVFKLRNRMDEFDYKNTKCLDEYRCMCWREMCKKYN